ncbi:Gpi1-domain-containing protein [Phlegmacium glaucopus]|nr:Gpi1-domain-containing protein [Phlegmacium glaucopus]
MSSPSSSTRRTTRSVFWPNNCTRGRICYGWMSPAICVAGVLQDSLSDAGDALLLSVALSNSPLWNPVKKSCGGDDPILLGTCEFDENSPVPSSLTLWNAIEEDENILVEFNFVLYHAFSPDSLRFYTLLPPEVTAGTTRRRDFYSELAQHDFTRPRCKNIDQALNEVVINQLNASQLIQSILFQHLTSLQVTKYTPFVPLLPKTASLLLALASHLALFTPLLIFISRLAAAFANLPLPSLSVQSLFDAFPSSGSESPSAGTMNSASYLRLKDAFATVQQLDVRAEQTVFFVTQITSLRRQNTYGVATYSSRYTNFFNTAWLIMNDMTLGVAFGAFLHENNQILTELANHTIQSLLFHLPRNTLYWLDAWPAGLKLNTELSRFYANTFIGIIDTWESLLPPIITPAHINALGILSSYGGLTLLLSLLSDLLSLLLTAHLRLAYELARGVYWGAGVKLGGGLLWGVFRGKRRNVLRNRTDTWSYDIDQLLFGTVLFTLLAFLFPTALVYYVLFAGLRLATLLVQASIETLLAFMHHFPLFALMLRIKDPQRLPGGVYFTLKAPSSSRPPSKNNARHMTYLLLENQPIHLSAIFFQYIELWNRLARHYNPLRLLYRVLAGQHLASIPRYSIRYASAGSSAAAEGTGHGMIIADPEGLKLKEE